MHSLTRVSDTVLIHVTKDNNQAENMNRECYTICFTNRRMTHQKSVEFRTIRKLNCNEHALKFFFLYHKQIGTEISIEIAAIMPLLLSVGYTPHETKHSSHRDHQEQLYLLLSGVCNSAKDHESSLYRHVPRKFQNPRLLLCCGCNSCICPPKTAEIHVVRAFHRAK